MLTKAEMRARMRQAVEATRYKSMLPIGECDTATVVSYLHHRRQEIVAAALGALDEDARALTTEDVLSILYREVAEDESPILAAA